MPGWVLVAVYALAVARITGLIVDDEITRPARSIVLAHLNRSTWPTTAVATILTCQWCASVWVAAAVIPAAWWHGRNLWLLLPALALAASQLTGMMSRLGRL